MGVDPRFKYFYKSPRMILKVPPTLMTSPFPKLYFIRKRKREREEEKGEKLWGWKMAELSLPHTGNVHSVNSSHTKEAGR